MRRVHVRFTLRNLMIGIAVCALALAVLREAPIIALFIGPLIGSLWEVKKGGKGLIGATSAGAITCAATGIFFVLHGYFTNPALHTKSVDIILLLVFFALYVLGGAIFGLAEGIAFWYLRYLATLPKRIRLRAERSARANSRRGDVTMGETDSRDGMVVWVEQFDD